MVDEFDWLKIRVRVDRVHIIAVVDQEAGPQDVHAPEADPEEVLRGNRDLGLVQVVQNEMMMLGSRDPGHAEIQ